jgi:hypothetical protein
MPADMTAQPPGGQMRTVLIAAADTADEGSAAVRAGADMVQFPADGVVITRFRARHRHVRVAVPAPATGLAGGGGNGPAAALAAGAAGNLAGVIGDSAAGNLAGVIGDSAAGNLAGVIGDGAAGTLPADVAVICADARPAAASWLPADRLLVEAPLHRVQALIADGWAVLVDADRAAALAAGDAGAEGRRADEVPGVVALAALACWLGATAVRTRQVAPVRRALDMTESIRGIRPPASAVRGLA